MDALSQFFFDFMPFFFVVGMVTTFTAPIVLFIYWKKLNPKPARTLFWSARRGRPPLLLCHDSGRGEMFTIQEKRGEGIVETGSFKILPRCVSRSKLAASIRATFNQPSLPAESGDLPAEDAKTRTLLQKLGDRFIFDYSDWVTKRTTLIGLGMPFFIGYTGKLCLMNPLALALFEAGEMAVDTEDQTMFNPHGLKDKKIEDAVKPIMLLDGRLINAVIEKSYDTSQIAAICQVSEDIGRKGRGLFGGKFPIVIAIILIVMLALGAVFFAFPDLLNPKKVANIPEMTGFLKTLLRH
jgi:hypothetical protein